MQHIRRALLAPGVLRYLEMPNAASSNFLMQKTEASAAMLSSKSWLFIQGFTSDAQQEPANRAVSFSRLNLWRERFRFCFPIFAGF